MKMITIVSSTDKSIPQTSHGSHSRGMASLALEYQLGSLGRISPDAAVVEADEDSRSIRKEPDASGIGLRHMKDLTSVWQVPQPDSVVAGGS
jgi:hypothetical protein